MAVAHLQQDSQTSLNTTPIIQLDSSSSDCSSSLLLTSSSSSGSTLSIPSQSSTSSSIDSSLQSLYTSCVFQNFPFRYLSSSPRGNSCVLSLAVVGDFVIAGTVADGMRVLRTQDLVASYGFDSGAGAGAGGAVKALLVHQAGILSAHQDGKIRIWRRNNRLQAEDDVAAEHQQRGGFKLSGSLPTTKDVLSNFLIPSNYVRVRRHRRQLWIRHADAVSCLACSGDVIFSGSWDKTVKIWRASDMKCLESFVAHDDAVNALAVNAHFLYTAGADGKIKAWERTPPTASSINKSKSKSSVTLVAVLERHKSSVNALAFDTASGYMYSASSDKSILVWEREDTAMHMAVVDKLKGHRRPVLCLAIAKVGDSTLLCSGSADKTIRVWRREREIHSCLCVVRGHQGPVKSVAMRVGSSASSGALVYSGSLDCHVKAWWVSLDGSDEDEGLEKKLVELKSSSF